jgi:tungstate transport system substrate-binding protein
MVSCLAIPPAMIFLLQQNLINLQASNKMTLFIHHITKATCYILLTIIVSACSNKESVRVGVTTTLEDSGILAKLITTFESEHNIEIKPVIAGSGQIHQLIQRGDIDTAITHDPKGEEKLLQEGNIKERITLMYNDFVIVGPNNDPSHIKLALTPDEAFEKIVNTGSTFVSRNDQSGTHQMEMYWWDKTSTTPPDDLYIKTGTGMGATLTLAIERKAYTLVDRGTWKNFSNPQQTKILFEDAELLPNRYSMLSLGNEKSVTWEKWLISDTAKKVIAEYRINTKPVFFLQKIKP